MELPIIFQYICQNKPEPNDEEGQNNTDSSYA